MRDGASRGGSALPELPALIGSIRDGFDAEHAARETGLAACRRIVQLSAQGIRAVHRQEYEAARTLLAEARAQVDRAQAALADHPAVYHAGFLHDAVKEYAEARITLAIVSAEPLPSPRDVGVPEVAYLHGLAEAAGELRRFALDCLRQPDFDRAERLMAAMDEIYSELVTFDYPEAITRGLRRSTDMVRGVSERTRGDLTTATLEDRLRREISELRARLDGAQKERRAAIGTDDPDA